MTELWISIVLGIVEGVTEFLPISSTGHLLLCERWLSGFANLDSDFWKRFVVFIQIGAIAAVVVFFRDRIMHLLTGHRESAPKPATDPTTEPPAPRSAPTTEPVAIAGDVNSAIAAAISAPSGAAAEPVRKHPLLLILIATVPVLVIGFALHKVVEEHLEKPGVIAAALVIGGVLMLLIERFRPAPRTEIVEDVTVGQAIFIGCAQVLAAIFPGTSRSAATILGGLIAGLNRPAAAEFSFFLAIPSMFAACGYSLLKIITSGSGLSLQQCLLLIIGTLTSFLVAWVVIAAFMTYIRKYSFAPFAVYRIILGLLVFWLMR